MLLYGSTGFPAPSWRSLDADQNIERSSNPHTGKKRREIDNNGTQWDWNVSERQTHRQTVVEKRGGKNENQSANHKIDSSNRRPHYADPAEEVLMDYFYFLLFSLHPLVSSVSLASWDRKIPPTIFRLTTSVTRRRWQKKQWEWWQRIFGCFSRLFDMHRMESWRATYRAE